MGSLFKQIYRYTRPRTFRHNENLWPWVKITRAPSGEICTLQYKGKKIPLVDLNEIRGSMHGEVLLTATGPSTKSINFSLLPKHIPVMGVNGAWYLSDRIKFSIYTIVDMGFYDSRPEIIRSIISQPDLILFTTMHGIAKILDRHGENLRCSLALIENACCKIYQPSINKNSAQQALNNIEGLEFHPQRSDIGFSTDIRSGIFDAGTVVYCSLQILMWLGFETILISGLDMNGLSQPRFYETEQDKLPSFLENKVDDLITPSFELAANVMQKSHVRAFNFSLKSAVPGIIFKKVSFDEYFKNK